MVEVRKYTLGEVTFCMGEALRGLDAGVEFPRLWRLFIEATVDKLKEKPDAVEVRIQSQDRLVEHKD